MPEKIKELINKNKELILYVIFGAATTLVDFGVSFMLYPTELNIHIIHCIAWVAAVAFAYVTNKLYVFESKVRGIGVIREILSFASSRVLTLLLQELIVFALYDKMGLGEYVVKIPAAIIVVLLNFVISKLFVFGGKGK